MSKNGNKRRLSSDDSSAESSEDEETDQCILEDSESEPELECDNWDNNCKIVTINSQKTLIGYHLMPTCSRNPEEGPEKKIKIAPEIRADLLDSSFKNEFHDLWTKNIELEMNKCELITSPFKLCVINEFLENSVILKDLSEEFNDIDWNLRSMDLYEFSQSKDLKHLTNHTTINSIYEFLKNDVMQWVSETTGIELTHISATCSLYNSTDYLLVHDDQREDRMVAFILYLTKNSKWDESKGGALQMLSKDSDGHPAEITRNIFPANNQFVFFPVANDSYHQVAEVTCLDDSRLSINGWFHTKIPPVYTTPKFLPYPQGLYGQKQHQPIDFDSELSSWITEGYMEGDIIDEIQEYFEQNSEISLKKFLKDEPFSQLMQILNIETLNWNKIGPPNRYCYEVATTIDLPVVLDRFLKLFQSKQMFSLLEKFTGLEFKETSYMKFELQKWTPGCYSLLGDYDWYDNKQLDLVLYFGCQDNSDVIGGRTLYVTTDEQIQDALITLEPEENNLNLIYRDTARFTKYFSKLSRCRCFYTLFCSYTE